MKYIKFISSLTITALLVYALNTKLGQAPPFGKFLNPFTGFWQNGESLKNYTDATYDLPGLKAEVTVYFDERLVPHVFAQNDDDLYYMQGYLTAKYRLWQMEIQTHNAAGRVSEIVGEKALEVDRLQRRIGMGYGAENAEAYISKDPHSKQLIQAYCDGVNAYISALSPKDYPVEYKLLDYAPEAWTPIKVGLLLKNMANMLSVFEYDIENHNFISKYGEEAFRQLYPDFIADEDPIIPKNTNWGFDGKAVSKIDGSPADSTMKITAQNAYPKDLIKNALTKPDEITGSNNWAVSGSKTVSGKPILCNDPHLRLSLPSIWYEMHLVSPGMNVYGATLPGSPAVIIGFNDSIAWGVTNGGRDVRDWYTVKFKDESKSEYEVNGQWLKTTKKAEVYGVRGKANIVDTVLYTKYGPVVFDENFGTADSKRNLAMSWTAHLPSNEFKTFYLMNRAKNYDDYLAALETYTCPAQNFVFASRSGDIAIKEQGRFPIREKQSEQGKFLSDGSNDDDSWQTFIPSAFNPTVKNPERGFVSSANQHPTDSTYPYYYPGVGVYENYRNRRINELLSDSNKINAAFMKRMQNDNFNLHAKEALPVLLALLDETKLNGQEKKMLTALRAWDFFNEANAEAPVYFEIWWNELRKMLWDEMLDKQYPLKQPNFYVTVKFLRDDSASVFYDVQATPTKETRAQIVLQSFLNIKDTLASKSFTEVSEPYGNDETTVKNDLDATNWGKYKDTKIAHLAGLDPFSSLHVINGGNLGVVNATNSTNGPSWRMIVDFGDMQGYVVYPGGQSGNPGSKFYNSMVDSWAKGEYYTTQFGGTPDAVKSKLFTSKFVPQK